MGWGGCQGLDMLVAGCWCWVWWEEANDMKMYELYKRLGVCAI